MEQSTQSGAAGAQSHASTENLNQKESGRNEELAGSGAGRVATGEPKKDADERQMMAAMAQHAGKGSENIGERYKKKDDEPSDINDDPSRIPQKFSGSAAEVGPAGLAAMVQDTPKGLGAR